MSVACKVSILVPVCNVQRYLRQCLDSLVAQTLEDIQIICLDDGSTDSSPAILDEYAQMDDRIEVVHKPNSGYGDSMNKGLGLARGEYVGIVESDDFASPEMFEELYNLAKQHDADVVKSNFLSHEEGNTPKQDALTENLGDGPFDTVFRPLDHQGIFLWRPAIWSGLYKASFLKENDIRFLPTPGASFQDTSFNFKVFAAAERAYLTKRAYLHYRTDNVNSSVKSQKKIFCICDEYREIWRFAEEREIAGGSLGKLIPFMQYGGYRWNLDRLTPSLQPGFYHVFLEEFQQLEKRGLLEKDRFNEPSWNDLSRMLADPEGYYRAQYGPTNVENSYLLLIPSGFSTAEKAIGALANAAGENDEILCAVATNSDAGTVERARANDKRVINAEEVLDSLSSGLLAPEKLRGNQLRVLVADDDASFKSALNELGTLDAAAKSPQARAHVIQYPKDYLTALKAPVFASLLAGGLYLPASEGDPALAAENRLWTPDTTEKCDPKDYLASATALLDLFDWVNDAFSLANPERRLSALRLIDPLWRLVRENHRNLKYSDKLTVGPEPSAETLKPAIMATADAEETPSPDISVVIPIYNAEAYLKECLNSVFSQSLKNIEAVCVIDGSSDRSLDILRAYRENEDRLTFAFQVNEGAGGARNRGMDLARGNRLAFIDPDDYYPDSNVLSLLHDAAERNGADICGGSFSTVNPEGEVKDRFVGTQSFYTFQKEGFRELAIDQNDYGWIRFIYKKSFLEESSIRFPIMQWYEDPVFFKNAADAAGKYYAVPSVAYRYREDFKPANWTVGKARDLLKGIEENLKFAAERNYSRMYTLLVHRLNEDYYEAITQNIDDYEVLMRLLRIQSILDPNMITFVRESGQNCFILRALDDMAHQEIGNTAIVRAARKVSRSKPYKALHAIRERFDD